MKKNLLNLDRRVIFIILLFGVALPLVFPIGFKSEVSPLAQQVYDVIESIPSGSVILLSFDYDPASAAELQPMSKAVVQHAWKRNLRIIAVALWPQGVQMAEQSFAAGLAKYPDKKYGIDYVNLGYKTGGIVSIQAMGKDFQSVFPSDLKGNSCSTIPITCRIKNFQQIASVVSFSAGDPGLKQYVMVAHDMYKAKVTGGTTAVSIPGFLPYINDQHQLYGLLGGLKGAAEYEKLVGIKGSATAGMDAQSVAHLLILVFIILGNLRVWLIKKEGR